MGVFGKVGSMKSAFFDVSQGEKEYVNSDKRSCCASAIQSFPAPRLRLSTPTGAQKMAKWFPLYDIP